MIRRLFLICLLTIVPASTYARGSSARAPVSRGSSTRSYQNSSPVRRSAPRTTSSIGSTPRTIGSNYHPSFSGYNPPFGSRVYSPGFSLTDLLLFSYLFNHNGNQQVIVEQPDGQNVTTQTSQIDIMYYVDIALLLILGFGLIGLIVWYINKKTQPKAFDKGLHYVAN
jgi:hypothetical protein